MRYINRPNNSLQWTGNLKTFINFLIKKLCFFYILLSLVSPWTQTQSKSFEKVQRFHEDGASYWKLANGPLAGRVAWAFDRPGHDSDPKDLLLSKIKAATSVEWASYKPTHTEIVQALIKHSNANGVFDGNYCQEECDRIFETVNTVEPVTLRIYKSDRKRKWFVMHHKFAIVRSALETGILTGSFNWTERATKFNFENLIYVKSKKIAAAYSNVFKKLPERESIEVTDGLISAGFNSAGVKLMKRMIEEARKNILVSVWSISVTSENYPNSVYDALVEASSRGVDVQILTDHRKSKKRIYTKLDVHPVHMVSRKAHMHHKFMVIDNKYVISGSYNFVTKSLSGNHENVVVIESPAMAVSFRDHWREIRNYEP